MGSRIGWRDRLALWCLRILAPHGVCGENVPMKLHFHSGTSSPEDPQLVMAIERLEIGQTIVAVVLDPNTVVETFSQTVDNLREWAAFEAVRHG